MRNILALAFSVALLAGGAYSIFLGAPLIAVGLKKLTATLPQSMSGNLNWLGFVVAVMVLFTAWGAIVSRIYACLVGRPASSESAEGESGAND
jgi:hypothetical protein